MFTRIQANGFKSLLSVDQRLPSFCALVGPNASGKTSFLDCIEVLSDVMKHGDVQIAMRARSDNFQNLTWCGKGHEFKIAVEATIPCEVAKKIADEKFRDGPHVRYELEIGEDVDGVLGINAETLWLTNRVGTDNRQLSLFPEMQRQEVAPFWKSGKDRRILVRKTASERDRYDPEGKPTYKPVFKLGRQKSALAHLPAEWDAFPVSSWFKEWLATGVQQLVLNSQKIRIPCPYSSNTQFVPDGSNLPWVINELREKDVEKFQQWLEHIQTALPDVKDITTVIRPEDRHCYLRVHYLNGAAVPSWLVSDGTLRLLSLTIPAYLRNFDGVYLVEEPENGIHPNAVETVVQSLSSIYDGQVIMATHSPIVLNLVETKNIICFAKDAQGATDVVAGDRHPRLQQWKRGNPDIGTLFASGVLC